MGAHNYYIGTVLLMALALSTKATQPLASRQRGYGLVKFEGEQPTKGQWQHGTISFQEQEHSQGNSQSFRFDDTQDLPQEPHYNPQNNVEQKKPISFSQGNAISNHEDGINGVRTGVNFQDDNIIEDQKGQKKRKKRRRRRRRPRLQQFPDPSGYPGGYPTSGSGYPIPGSGYPTPESGNAIPGSGYPAPGSGYPAPGSGYPSPGSGYPEAGIRYPVPGFGYPNPGSGYPAQEFGFPAAHGQNPYGNPTFGPDLYEPLRRPRPQSVATDALARVTGALASIARYDDYQCVPRLLCEAAGNGGALGAGAAGTGAAGSGLLQSVAALQPLLTLLTAYNGISSSPLFIFGRAVFLGMTSRGTPGSSGAAATCRYAYPLCPTDPEQLVYYLNNHNGGFFRFFNAPHQRPSPQYGLQQNLEQFYNQLAAPVPNSGQYGFYQPAENLGGSQGQYGQLGYPTPGSEQGYGLYNNGGLNQHYNPNNQIPNGYPNYGATYPYNQSQQNYGFAKNGLNNNESELKAVETNKIEKRIQNVKSEEFDESIFSTNIVDRNKYTASRWLFPNTNSIGHNKSGNKSLYFPNENSITDHSTSEANRKARGFNFPGPQTNRDTDVYAFEATAPSNGFGDSLYQTSQTEAPQDEGVEVVYIVRGDGDPKNPEVVKLRPGQSIQSIGIL